MRSFAALRMTEKIFRITDKGKSHTPTEFQRIRIMYPILFILIAVFLLPACETIKPREKTYTLTVITGENGTVSPISGTYKEGTVVALTASPDSGYRFLSWKGTDNDASTEATNAVTMNGNKTVEVAFVSLLCEDFERAESTASWVFGNGPEFPGANGSFAVVDGRGRSNSKGGVLAFNFSGGGNYVIATQSFTSAVPVKGVSFWVSGYVPGTQIIVRLTDESGTTFQYLPIVAAPAGTGGGAGAKAAAEINSAAALPAWNQVRVYLEDWDSSWEGAGDGVFHGGVKQIGIGVDKSLKYYMTGEFAFDDVAEISSAEVAFDPFGQDRLPEFYAGPVSALLGVNIHFIRPRAELLDMAKRAGLGFVRMDLFWQPIETRAGQYDFSEYDLLMRALEERGMGALFILDYGNPLYYDGPGRFGDKWGPHTDAARAAYAGFAVAAARHYENKRVMLEIWNEPNGTTFWAPTPNPGDYGLLASAAVKAVKAECPGVPVVVGATAGCDIDFLGRVFDVPGLADADAVSVHPYRAGPPESFVQDRIRVQDLLRKKTGRRDIPLYSGEWGYPATNFGERSEPAWKKQAVYAIRLMLINIWSGVPKTVWYDIMDDGPDPKNAEHNFGLVAEDGRAKPAYNAVKALYDLLPGRESETEGSALRARKAENEGATGASIARADNAADPEREVGAENEDAGSWTISAVDTRTNNIYGLVFRNASGQLAALWTSRTRSAVEVKIPDNAGYKFYDMYGAALTPAKREGGYCYLALHGDAGPVYVKY